MFADRIAHEWRNEGAEQRPGDTGEETSQPDERHHTVRRARASRSLAGNLMRRDVDRRQCVTAVLASTSGTSSLSMNSA